LDLLSVLCVSAVNHFSWSETKPFFTGMIAMSTAATIPADFLLNVHREVEINAPAALVFEAILEQSGPGFATPDGNSMQMKLEPWPGGRWFRDLGNNTGHLWGHVQVSKPPTLLEITGPMFMSYAVASHVQYRLAEKAGVTTLSLTHRAMGEISPQHRSNVSMGWEHILGQIKSRAVNRIASTA
jgi:uncharacterized protein YndB with AHSA1/START domain